MSSSICNACYENPIESSSLLNELNDLRNRLNNISICQSKFVKNLEEYICQFDKFNKENCDQYLNKTKEILDNLNSNENNLKQTIELIEINLNQFQQSIISISPSIEQTNVLNSSVSLESENDYSNEKTYSYHFHLSPQTSFYPYLINSKKRIKIPSDNCLALSTNDKYFVIIGKTFIYLFNENFQMINKKYFNQGKLIKDICWSKSLNRFILISSKQIFLLDEIKMIIKPYKLYFDINKCWQRVTCSEKYLFLSTYGENPFLIQFYLFPSIQFYRKYQKEIISNKNQFLNDIKSNENYFIIIIEDNLNNKSYFRIYLLESFQLISNILLGNGWSYRSCLFNNRYWIILDNYNNRFIFILNDGNIIKIESYFTKPINIISWNQNQIIIQTNQFINIHQSQ